MHAAIKTDAANHLKVTVEGSQISAFANGVLLARLEDDSFTTGQIGLIAETGAGSQPVKVAFDNLEIGQSAAQVTPTPLPTPTALYQDDFSDPQSGWPRSNNASSAKNYEDGGYIIQVKEESLAAWAIGSDETYTDFSAEVDASQTAGEDEGYFGFVFRYVDTDNFYYFLASSGGQYRVGKIVDNEWEAVDGTDWDTSSAIQTGAENHLKIVAIGSQIEAYANDVLLATLNDDSFAEGMVGLIGETGSGSQPIKADVPQLRGEPAPHAAHADPHAGAGGALPRRFR